MELKYTLLSFGIPADTLPIDSKGNIKYDLFAQHVKERRMLETKIKEQMAINNHIACPTDIDVLLGRGRPFQEYVGNLRLNRIVDTYFPSYNTMTRSEKTRTVGKVIGLFHQSGGRFLRRLPTTSTFTSTESNILNDVDGDNDTTTTTTMHDRIINSSYTDVQPAVGTITTSVATAAGWEIVYDKNLIHRKVNNVFKTRKSHALSSSSSSS